MLTLDQGVVITNEGLPKSKLRKLSLTRSPVVPPLYIQQLHPRLQELEELSLIDDVSLVDQRISAIVESLPKLRYLNLSGSKVTGVGVKEALKLKHLERLVLDDCRDLGFDAVEWAREKGVQVQYRMNEKAAGGSKVRY